VTPFDPYRSEAARDSCFAIFDARAAAVWPSASESRIVPTSWGPTFVRITGPPGAPPLVLLHGGGANSLMWSPNVAAWSAAFRVYAVDQVNEFGKSLCARPLRNFGELVDWLDEFLTGAGLAANVNLLGISYGGALAAQYALRHPERLAKLVLLAPGNTVLHLNPEFFVRILWGAVNRASGMPAFFRWVFADMRKRDPQWVDGNIEDFALNGRSSVRRKPVFPPVLTDGEWRGLRVPTCFLMGENDVIYSARKAVRRLNRVAPQVRAEIVPAAGHDFTIAHAAEVNRKVLDFLAANSTTMSATT
jgi:pimeloyl-ACP methyl ester carboxylesterase